MGIRARAVLLALPHPGRDPAILLPSPISCWITNNFRTGVEYTGVLAEDWDLELLHR
jgi:hypothetical protein